MRVLIRPINNKDDINYIIESHCRIYNEEHNFDHTFNEFITNSLIMFADGVNSKKEQIWLIDNNGVRQGSIGIIDAGNNVAQLRWLLVEPKNRGVGYGNALMDVAINHCSNYYNQIILWTNSKLISARKLYERHGFNIEEIRKSYLSNQEIIEEKWIKSLSR